jgi:acetoin utilization deacetylase AcuC-like enzyme
MYIIYDDFYLKHSNGPSHPENENRLIAIKEALDRWEFKDKIIFKKPSPAENSQIEMVHDRYYVQQIMDLSVKGSISYLDPDTAVTEHTYKCALLAAGGCFKGLDLIFGPGSECSSFFAVIRPPGHHAFRDRGSGFCIFNNMALSARYAQKKWDVKKLVIIDFDAHHGNGTQEIFYDDCSVFYISFHQYPHYPGTGYYREVGRGRGKGFNMNFPFKSQTDDTDYLTAMMDIVIPIVDRFEPELFLVSAGYDSHLLDPLSTLNLIEESYYKIMCVISYLSCRYSKGKIGMMLEGGYDYNATAKSVLESIRGCFDKEMFTGSGGIDRLKSKLEINSDFKNRKIDNPDVLESIKEIFKV